MGEWAGGTSVVSASIMDENTHRKVLEQGGVGQVQVAPLPHHRLHMRYRCCHLLLLRRVHMQTAVSRQLWGACWWDVGGWGSAAHPCRGKQGKKQHTRGSNDQQQVL